MLESGETVYFDDVFKYIINGSKAKTAENIKHIENNQAGLNNSVLGGTLQTDYQARVKHSRSCKASKHNNYHKS